MILLCAFTSTAAEKSHSLSVVLGKPENARTETVLPDLRVIEISRLNLYFSDAASGWAARALAHLEYGSLVDPITRVANYAHHITATPPGFENPVAALKDIFF